jgi:hypothetical protein
MHFLILIRLVAWVIVSICTIALLTRRPLVIRVSLGISIEWPIDA